jgi:hypothetical protein
MVLIEVRGPLLMTPIRITDPTIQEFSVWAGPGVNGSGIENAKGFIIDWHKGVVDQPPTGLTRYELSFYDGCRLAQNCQGEKPSLVYVVAYEYDPSSNRGFVYLPGKGEASYYLNVGTIYHGHGAEGHWFVASSEWNTFIRPLIAWRGR